MFFTAHPRINLSLYSYRLVSLVLSLPVESVSTHTLTTVSLGVLVSFLCYVIFVLFVFGHFNYLIYYSLYVQFVL